MISTQILHYILQCTLNKVFKFSHKSVHNVYSYNYVFMDLTCGWLVMQVCSYSYTPGGSLCYFLHACHCSAKMSLEHHLLEKKWVSVSIYFYKSSDIATKQEHPRCKKAETDQKNQLSIAK